MVKNIGFLALIFTTAMQANAFQMPSLNRIITGIPSTMYKVLEHTPDVVKNPAKVLYLEGEQALIGLREVLKANEAHTNQLCSRAPLPFRVCLCLHLM